MWFACYAWALQFVYSFVEQSLMVGRELDWFQSSYFATSVEYYKRQNAKIFFIKGMFSFGFNKTRVSTLGVNSL